MKLSAEFLEFSLQFYQDILDDVSSEEELISTVLSPFKEEQKRARLVITHPCDRWAQAPMVLRMAPKGPLPVRRAVSTTVRMSASPSAAHIAR